MKVTLPENISEITLEQFQSYSKLVERKDLDEYQFNKRKVSIFTGIKYKDLDNINQLDFVDILTQIDLSLNVDAEFKPRFEMGGVEFGFIPNFDKMTTKEFVDLSLYPVSDVETYHKLLAILFRPIKNKDTFGNYKLKNYNGTEKYAELMKQTPMNIVNGALVFFCNLANELQQSTKRYIQEELKKAEKQVTTLKSGDGTVQLNE